MGEPASFVGYVRSASSGVCRSPVAPAPIRVPVVSSSTRPRSGSGFNIERSISAVNGFGDWTFKATDHAGSDARSVPGEGGEEVDYPRVLEAYCQALGVQLNRGFFSPGQRDSSDSSVTVRLV